ncbi:MAG: hypothetical protein N3I35_13180 [Clostridia bacterium]|nr:hypothetical protein [Clostridia bacterium]
MSLVLGKIHYWLYNKIQWFEAIEEDIILWAGENGLPVREWTEEINDRFGHPTYGKPLENEIDTSNIHGWLQQKIQSAELRQADLITRILNHDKSHMDELIKIYSDQGGKAASEYGVCVDSAEDIFQALNNYLLEGMPCDRVMEVVSSNINEVVWQRSACLHKPYWDRVRGDVKYFYSLREAWISSFVEMLNHDFRYKRNQDGTCSIFKI